MFSKLLDVGTASLVMVNPCKLQATGKEDRAEKEAKDDDEDAADDLNEIDADDEDEIAHAIVDLSLPAFPGFPKDEVFIWHSAAKIFNCLWYLDAF